MLESIHVNAILPWSVLRPYQLSLVPRLHKLKDPLTGLRCTYRVALRETMSRIFMTMADEDLPPTGAQMLSHVSDGCDGSGDHQMYQQLGKYCLYTTSLLNMSSIMCLNLLQVDVKTQFFFLH